MTERFEVQRQIAAPPAKVFAIVSDPQGHVKIDSSGMLQSAEGEPVQQVGDQFVVHMDRESLNDYPMGKYDVTVLITKFEPDSLIEWTVTGALTGTMEVWLEAVLDGVVLHYFLHAEPSGVTAWELARMNLAKSNHRRRVAGKAMAFEVKRKLEETRPVGVSRLA